uniref:Putative ovule protein n=1 Tax=Solanum chacoense TaxID=4108 RepID=A0A0V0IF74_SOLCH
MNTGAYIITHSNQLRLNEFTQLTKSVNRSCILTITNNHSSKFTDTICLLYISTYNIMKLMLHKECTPHLASFANFFFVEW